MDDLLELGDRLVTMAAPDEQVEVVLGAGRGTSVRAYDGEIEAFTSATSRAIGVRVVVDGRQGFASAGTLDDGVAVETLAEARDNALFAQPDEHVGLAEPDGVEPIPLDPWSPVVGEMTDGERIELAIDLERRVRSGDPRITGVRSASYGDAQSTGAIVSSTGIRVAGRSTHAGVSVLALAADGDDTTTGYGYDSGRDHTDLDIERVADDAVERSTAMLGATKPASARLAIVLEPRFAASLLGIAAGMLSGERVLKGRSPFAERLGEKIAAPMLTLVDDPTDARSIAADDHDGEGLATRRNVLFAAGELRTFLYDSYSARRAGTASTASAVRSARSTPSVGIQALAVEPGTGSVDDLVGGIDLGIAVHSMSGLHSGVNAVSGDFSVGVEGHMIRAGARAEPVREATIASTIPRMLLDLRAIADDLTWLPSGAAMCTMAIDGVTLGGT
ncbi:MAG: TldD/PmbA family protein [Acidimicrobiia bacterium]|nr:TldD/PmbA family protein [Acidimicrobiia bacterium]